MKKHVLCFLVAIMMLSLVACGKSQGATNADNLIAAIGEVTLDSENKIIAAENAVAALSDKDRGQLENEAVLMDARAKYEKLVLEAEEKAKEEAAKVAAAEIEAIIAEIGEVTLESEAAIAAARSAFAAAEPLVQGFVANIGDLEAAEAALNGLKVQTVVDLINAIGNVTLESGSAIQAAQDAYNALSNENKDSVSNFDVLGAAVDTLATLKKQQGQALLNSFRVEADPVRGMNFYYPMAFPYYTDYWGADVRCFVLPYLGQQGDDVWLRLVCDYTADDWIFFEKITFAVDDERYYETFNYFDVVRDNGYGDIWEYVDMEVGSSEIEMLWAIANSTTTIVRFESDDYYDDFTVSAADKQAIREILTAYEALK